MELFSSTTRFALSCNNSSKVIEPIQSRCAILRYTRLSDVQLVERLQHVIAAENIVAWTKEGLEALVFTAEGDMRQVRARWNFFAPFAYGFHNAHVFTIKLMFYSTQSFLALHPRRDFRLCTHNHDPHLSPTCSRR